MNILILSCGTRNKIVQYFKRELKGKGLVFATDCSNLAPALYEADQFFIVPKIDTEEYLPTIYSICKKYNIRAIFSLIDPEISMLAEHRTEFLDIGTIPILPNFNTVELCFNKYSMYKFLLDKGFNAIKSYIDKEKFYSDIELGILNYPVFVKPIKGSASKNITIATSKEEIDLLFEKYDDLMIQEFMNGIEYGVDVYIDLISSELVAMFIKEKIMMRAGETDKSVSVKDPELYKLIEDFTKVAEFKGVIDIDVFKLNGQFYISEVNPRFGGGYPHAYESGVNIPEMIVNNLNGNINENVIGKYDENIFMMKFNEIKIIR